MSNDQTIVVPAIKIVPVTALRSDQSSDSTLNLKFSNNISSLVDEKRQFFETTWNDFDLAECQLQSSNPDIGNNNNKKSLSSIMMDGNLSKQSYSSSSSSSSSTPTSNFYPETILIAGSNPLRTQQQLSTILENEDNQLTDSSSASSTTVGQSKDQRESKGNYKYKPRAHVIEPLTPPSESELANEDHDEVNYHPMVYQFQGNFYQLKIDPATNNNNNNNNNSSRISNSNNTIGNIGNIDYSNEEEEEVDYFDGNNLMNQREEEGGQDGGVYENYSIDYDNDYERYYDDQRANRWVNGAALADDADEEIVEIEVGEEMEDEELDVDYDPFDQSKLYYHHYQQQQQQQGSQSSQMELNPGILMPPTYYGFKPDNGQIMNSALLQYGNPFAYNLHTIIEESENESSIQTLSSLTSSTLQSLPFESSSSMNVGNEDDSENELQQNNQKQLNNSKVDETSAITNIESSTSVQKKYAKNKTAATSMSYDDEEDDDDLLETLPHLSSPPIATHSQQSKLEQYFTSSLLENSGTGSGIGSAVPAVPAKRATLANHLKNQSTRTNLAAKSSTNKMRTKRAVSTVSTKNPNQNSLKNNKLLFYRILDYILNRTDSSGRLVHYFDPLDSKMIVKINQKLQIDLIDSLSKVLEARSQPDQRAQQRANRLTSQVLALLNCRPRSTSDRFSIYDRLVDYLVRFKSIHQGIHFVLNHRIAGRHIRLFSPGAFYISELQYFEPRKRTKRFTFQNDLDCQRTSIEALPNTSCIKITINGQSIAICENKSNKPGLSSRNSLSYYHHPNHPDIAQNPVYRTVLQINKQDSPTGSEDPNGDSDYSDYDTLTATTNNAKKLSKFFKLSNPLNRNFLAKFLINENNGQQQQGPDNFGGAPSTETGQEPDQNQKSKHLAEKVAKMENEIESSVTPSRKSSNSLLGSLRSRSKERQKMMPCKEITNPDTIYRTHVNGENGKFKTISSIGFSYSQSSVLSTARSSNRFNSTADNSTEETIDGQRKRSSKCSKSFRDQRTTSLSSDGSDKSNSSSSNSSNFTWDKNMAGGINRLWNTFRSKSTSSSSSSKSAKNIAVSKDDSDTLSVSNRNKSFSEPNLHDDDSGSENSTTRSADKSPNVTTNFDIIVQNSNLCFTSSTNLRASSGMLKSDNKSATSGANGQLQPQQQHQSSKSTPQLASEACATESGRKYKAPLPDPDQQLQQQSKASSHKRLIGTASTPSLLYRLSNISTTAAAAAAAATNKSGTNSGSQPQQFKRINSLDDSKKSSTLRRGANMAANEDQSWLNHHQIRQNGGTEGESTNDPSLDQTPFEKNSQLSRSYRGHQEMQSHDKPKSDLSPNRLSLLKSSMRLELRPNKTESSQAAPPISTSHSSTLPQRPAQALSPPPSNRAITGEILLSIGYEMKVGNLDIVIHKCRVYRNIKLDLYVKVYLLPDRNKTSKRKTKIKRNTLEPEFNEVLQFLIGSDSATELATRKLWICVWNSDSFGRNGLIGETVLELEHSRLVINGPTYCQLKWFPLMQPATFISSIEFKESPEVTGSLFLAIKYQTEGFAHDGSTIQQNYGGSGSQTVGKLNVLIKEARNLNSFANTNNGTFCKLTLLPDRTKLDRQKSFTVKHGTSPRWNQTFVFDNIGRDQICARGLQITIWYQEKLSSKTYLGGIYLSQNSVSLDEEASLWNQMLERQNMWVYGEISLRTLGLQSRPT